MIQLPENWKDTVRISPRNNALFLHFRNDANEYWLYYFRLDPAFPLQHSLDEIEADLTPDYLAKQQALIMHSDLSEERVEPADQNWVPAPLPGLDVLSVRAYQTMNQVKSAPAPKADPIPGPEGLPNVE